VLVSEVEAPEISKVEVFRAAALEVAACKMVAPARGRWLVCTGIRAAQYTGIRKCMHIYQNRACTLARKVLV